MLLLIALLGFSGLADAKVSFTYSTIYDEYDLNGKTEVGLESCIIGGCSVFVSTPQWNLDNLRNVFFYSQGTNVSLFSIATDNDPITWAKKGAHTANTEAKIQNFNKGDVGPIAIYVVGSQAANYNSKDVEIYDASNINMRPSKDKKFTMIMSAEPFNLFVQALGTNLNAYVRATGFDNNFQRESPDQCRIIYDQNEGKPFRIRINSPIVTIAFDGQSNYQICAKIDQNNEALLDYPGVATSQGYIGCERNLFAVYRSSIYTSSVFELHDDHNTERSIDLNYVVNTIGTDTVVFNTFNNGGNGQFEATGQGKTPVARTEKAFKINVQLPAKNHGSSYWVAYSDKNVASIPSAQGVCTDWTQTSPDVTAPTQPSTTSGANEFFTLLTSAIIVFISRQF